tara:strand:- start:39 stop:704 length:666 start_codon:yes stop_codon:yes gene_type:complete
MNYPVTIVDDFFLDPNAIRDFALSLDYPMVGSHYPGKRSNFLHEVDFKFFNYFGNKIFSLFGTPPLQWGMNVNFQKIEPYAEDKWDRKNRGWIHKDNQSTKNIEGSIFGGIVYLNPNPDPDTGTSIYKTKRGFTFSSQYEMGQKMKLYGGEELDDNEYNKVYDETNEQFVETIKVDNVYNRLLLFSGNTYHGMRTIGTEERLTLPFFCVNTGDFQAPNTRY